MKASGKKEQSGGGGAGRGTDILPKGCSSTNEKR